MADSVQSENTRIVLASDFLPDLLPLLPMPQRPAFPGMFLPIMLPAGPLAEAAIAAAQDISPFLTTFQQILNQMERLDDNWDVFAL